MAKVNIHPLISIITVTYNAEKYLERCINSIVRQNYKNIQLIIVDGGSTDSTLKIIEKFKKYVNILISEPDFGIYDAMNKGIENAIGDWLLFLNSDDYLFNADSLSGSVPYLANKNTIYFGTARIISDEGVFLYEKPNNVDIKKWLKKNLPIHQSVFISSNFKEIKYDISYKVVADSIYLKALSNITEFSHIPVKVVNFQLGGVSSYYQSASDFKKHLIEHINYLKINRNYLGIPYSIFAISTKFIISRIIPKQIFFKIIGYVAKIKSRF